MSAHTAGTWRVSYPYVVSDDARETIVCEVTGAPSNDAAQADARLIAAAPDLLAALRNLLDASERHIFSDECLRERDAARAAIARAEGK